MSEILCGQIRVGDVLVYNNQLCKVVDVNHVKPGKGGAFAQVEMFNIQTNTKYNQRFSTSDKIEKAFLEKKILTYAYQDGQGYIFVDDMGTEKRLNADELDINPLFLTEGCEIEGQFHDESLIQLEWPSKSSVVFKVDEVEGYQKGATVTQRTKKAVLENGLEIDVPVYVEVGQLVKINPSDGSFIEVVK